MKFISITGILIFILLIAPGFSRGATVSFPKDISVVPLPADEKALPTVEAVPLAVVGNNGQTLEGAMFDASGNLFFCNTSDRKVMRLSPDGKLETVIELEELSPGGLAFHKDGRLFIAALDLKRNIGEVLALVPGDDKTEIILPGKAGYMPNDLVFDANGGFYFSDFKGNSTTPEGGIYYVSPDFKNITPVMPNMAKANGVALSPDGRVLWATEYGRNLLHRTDLASPTSITPTGSKIPYHFTGIAPDSMRVDSKGNVYVALMGQGRVMIFNQYGLPIGQALLPERDMGNNLRSASLALHPAREEMRIVAGNIAGAASQKATVFTAPAFARGQDAQTLK